MPRRRRPENQGLPSRWQYAHGAYYYRVPPGQEDQWDGKKRFRLGSSLPEAYATWSERIQYLHTSNTVADLLDRYALEVIPTNQPKARRDKLGHIRRLNPVFGRMPLTAIRPRHFYQYVDKREAKVSARRDLSTLSHALSKAVEWGLIDRHPTYGQVRIGSGPPRTRYVEDWEVVELLSLPARRKRGSVRMIQGYIRLKMLTGLRRSDLLRLRTDALRADGIHVQPGKTASRTGQRLIYEWSPALREAVDMALEARPVDIGPFLFCTQRGECYISEKTGEASSWDSMWQRFMRRALEETEIQERFTEHDLRAKVGSDAESLERARQILSHADQRLTQRVYRRKPERVRPLR